MRVLHPENFGKVVELDILFCPPIKCGGRIVVLVTGDVSRRPSDRAWVDHLPKSAKQVKVRIGRLQGPGIEGFVESRQTVASNFDAARSNFGQGTDKIHKENDSEESSKLAPVGPLVVRVARHNVQAKD